MDDPAPCEAIWITIRVPAEAEPGSYTGQVRIRSGEETKELPLTVRVWSFALPETTELRAVFDLRQGPGPTPLFPGPEPDKVTEAWYRLMADHRVTPDTLPQPAFREEDGRIVLDWEEFDRWAELCLDELGMNHLYTPWPFYAFGWAYAPGPFMGREAFTPEWREAISEAYTQFVDHLEARGWHDRLIHYVSDEPHMWVDSVIPNLQRCCALFDELAPDVPRYSSTWTYDPGLDGAITLWGAGHYGCFPVESMRQRQAAGDGILFTTDGQMCIDTPWCAIERLLPWYARRWGAIGYEFWGVSWWTYDPSLYGYHSFISQSDQGDEFYWIRYPNGDGYLAYPGAPFGLDVPVPSLRLVLAREGQEDGEYLRLLEQLLAEAPEDSEERRLGEAALEAAQALVPIPNAGGLRSSDILPNPTAVADVRTQVAEAIEACLGDSRGARP